MRSPVAADTIPSRGRLFEGPCTDGRSEFARDRQRIIHSAAFRRLSLKTQVFSLPSDHVRTRLTHTLEVAQIARGIAARLNLDPELSENIALGHDLGHSPLGHRGEHYLDEVLADRGGFDHNAQAVAIVERLERRYAAFDGLDLTFEALEGIIAHNGPLVGPDGLQIGKRAGKPVPEDIRRAARLRGIDLSKHPSAEAQIAALSDDCAYLAADLEDGLRSGVIDLRRVREVELVDRVWRASDLDSVGDHERKAHEISRGLISRMASDIAQTSAELLQGLTHPDQVRDRREASISLSGPMAALQDELKSWLYANLYWSDAVKGEADEAARNVGELVTWFLEEPSLMPGEWGEGLDGDVDLQVIADRVRDYVSGMTDRYAMAQHHAIASGRSLAPTV